MKYTTASRLSQNDRQREPRRKIENRGAEALCNTSSVPDASCKNRLKSLSILTPATGNIFHIRHGCSLCCGPNEGYVLVDHAVTICPSSASSLSQSWFQYRWSHVIEFVPFRE